MKVEPGDAIWGQIPFNTPERIRKSFELLRFYDLCVFIDALILHDRLLYPFEVESVSNNEFYQPFVREGIIVPIGTAYRYSSPSDWDLFPIPPLTAGDKTRLTLGIGLYSESFQTKVESFEHAWTELLKTKPSTEALYGSNEYLDMRAHEIIAEQIYEIVLFQNLERTSGIPVVYPFSKINIFNALFKPVLEEYLFRTLGTTLWQTYSEFRDALYSSRSKYETGETLYLPPVSRLVFNDCKSTAELIERIFEYRERYQRVRQIYCEAAMVANDGDATLRRKRKLITKFFSASEKLLKNEEREALSVQRAAAQELNTNVDVEKLLSGVEPDDFDINKIIGTSIKYGMGAIQHFRFRPLHAAKAAYYSASRNQLIHSAAAFFGLDSLPETELRFSDLYMKQCSIFRDAAWSHFDYCTKENRDPYDIITVSEEQDADGRRIVKQTYGFQGATVEIKKAYLSREQPSHTAFSYIESPR